TTNKFKFKPKSCLFTMLSIIALIIIVALAIVIAFLATAGERASQSTSKYK
ncbi:unnamed protein product, partial [Rotaria magnacalcarata]